MSATPDAIPAALRTLIAPSETFEIRIIKPLNGYGTHSGYFDNIETAAKVAASWSGKCSAVYMTLNPVKPDLLARAANRIKKLDKQDRTTTDADITARRWFPLDFDPVRPSGISSTDAEHAAAIAKAREARDWLAAQGWPAPILADSGNGAHLLYRIDLPNDEASKLLVERAIKALAHKLDDRTGHQTPVCVDQSVFNAARIWKVYGTLAAKGDSTQYRPHRMAQTIEAPDEPSAVSLAQLQALAWLAPEEKKPEPLKPRANAPGGDFFSRVNDRAISSLAAWVPALFPAATAYRDGYRVTSKALGRDLEEALSILPTGIKDFGLHDQGDAQGGKRTPVDLVIEHGGASDAKSAAFWLCGQFGIEPRALGWEEKSRTPEPSPSQQPATRQPTGDDARPASTPELTDENLFSDYGNVIKLRARLSDRLAYTPGLDWLIYNPATGIWEPEPCGERVKRLALETLRDAWSSVFYAAQRDEADLKNELKALDGDDPRAAMVQKKVKLATVNREKIFQWVRQCETAYRIRSTLEIAEGYFWTAPAVWDANPHILVCANGVLDLATGTLLPHSPGHRATKTTGTAFKPGAQHPAWDAVTTLLKAEGDRYTFIHQYCGSGLHGANPNERLVIAQGDGGTGKGTLLTAIHQALGAYAETIEVGSLLATDWRRQNKSAPREDLLKLRGARFVSPGIEPPKDSKLDDGSIKALTGNDAISARAPHATNSITFTPVFKLILQTNFPLRTEFDDPGMKRRVIVVPFNQKPDRPDPAVKDALIRDPDARAACLAWLYEGYRAWRNAGYALPESALAMSATAEYWADMNPYEQFAADVGLKFGKLERCPKPKLTGALKAWRDETGRFDASLKGFPGWLKSKGCFDQQVTGGSRLWYGVSFAEASSPQSQESPPLPVNRPVDFQHSKSMSKFQGTASDSGYNCYKTPPPDSSPTPTTTGEPVISQHTHKEGTPTPVRRVITVFK